MGEYSATCGLSHLAIEPGTKVVWLALTESSYGWVHRSLPVLGTYDGYGHFEPELDQGSAMPTCSIAVSHFVASLQDVLVELPVGDNVYHDIPAEKGRDFEHYCRAIEATETPRLRVRQDRAWRMPVDSGNAAMPTAQTVTEILTGAGMSAFHVKDDKDYFGDQRGTSLYVQQVAYGWVRIFFEGANLSEQAAKLREAQRCIPETYGTVVRAGEPRQAILDIFALPGEHTQVDYERKFFDYDPTRDFRVSAVIVRRDVWDAAANFSVKRKYESHVPLTAEQEAEELKGIVSRMRCADDMFKTAFSLSVHDAHSNAVLREMLSIPSGRYGLLGDAVRALANSSAPIDSPETRLWLKLAGELAVVTRTLRRVRQSWAPTWPMALHNQYGDFAAQAKWLRRLAKIADAAERSVDF